MPPEASPQPLLTLAIPTYNRAANLELLLAALAPAARRPPPGRAPRLRQRLPRRTPNPSCAASSPPASAAATSATPINIGADANFLQCYRQAAGKYVWIFGDDDFLFPGSLARIISLLAAGRVRPHLPHPLRLPRTSPTSATSPAPTPPPSRSPRPPGLRPQRRPARRPRHALRRHRQQDLLESASPPRLRRRQRHQPPPDGLGLHRAPLLPPRPLSSSAASTPSASTTHAAASTSSASSASTGPRPHDTSSPPTRSASKPSLNDQLYSWFPTNWYGMRRNPDHTHIRDPVGQMRPIYGNRPVFWFLTWPLLAWPCRSPGLARPRSAFSAAPTSPSTASSTNALPRNRR